MMPPVRLHFGLVIWRRAKSFATAEEANTFRLTLPNGEALAVIEAVVAEPVAAPPI